MSLPIRHIFNQGPVIASLGGTAVAALRQRLLHEEGHVPTELPGPEIVETIAPRPAELVRDYVRHVGGDPSAWKGELPPHLFPQWGFPLAAKTLRGLPYPLARVLNGGCRLEVNGPLPSGKPLRVAARLQGIDDNGRRVVLHQRVATGTDDSPELVVGHLFAIVPLGGGKGDKKPGGDGKREERKDPPRVPADAVEIAYWRIPADAGLAFAMLTGDFNPVHWIKPYAKAFGFRSTILHGFSTMARAIEGLGRGRFAGDSKRVRLFDCKFTRPLILPARVGLYTRGDSEVFVGDAPGGPAYLVGTYQAK